MKLMLFYLRLVKFKIYRFKSAQTCHPTEEDSSDSELAK